MASGHDGMLALAQGRVPPEQAHGNFDLDVHNRGAAADAPATCPWLTFWSC